VWICPVLEHPDGKPADEFFTRSDWPLRARIVWGVLSEAQELSLLRGFWTSRPAPPRRGGFGSASRI
jgi:hypothetical protein